MKNIRSLISCMIIGIVLFQYREINITPEKPLKITLWDANGYYLYLPAILKYHDFKQLNWLSGIDKKYSVTGGGQFQALRASNGNYAFKYLGGVALMELPFYLVADWVAIHYGYPPDGFSPPYQYALGFGILLYSILAVFLLRKILLLYFSDFITAVTLLLVCLATNYIQYAAVDSGQSHAYIFFLYAIVLYTTIKWHKRPSILWASLTGYFIGLATICRPTEAIMICIPLLWNTQTKEIAKSKWLMVKQHRNHIAFTVLFGLIGILPQLIYWKIATGSFIFDVGSSWDFLLPHLQVLFGFEKGWFIYTPITLFFVIALFRNKKFPFSKSAIWFCLLNIYIIISWRDWHYGGSYSARALVQSYPVFALPFAAFIEQVNLKKWRIPFYILCTYLLLVNLFQITQYCCTILHYDSMNRKYYSRIYLNPNPSPLDMSMLDDDEMLHNEKAYKSQLLINTDNTIPIHFPGNSSDTIFHTVLANPTSMIKKWIKVEATIDAPSSLWLSNLNADLQTGDSIKHVKVRLLNGITETRHVQDYAFYMSMPAYFHRSALKVYLTSPNDFNGFIKKIKITEFDK